MGRGHSDASFLLQQGFSSRKQKDFKAWKMHCIAGILNIKGVKLP
jgi:hypothetical protein